MILRINDLLARLASAITSGNAAKVDFDILDKGCDHKKKAYKLIGNIYLPHP
jgi:hypothetical protein